MFTENSGVVCQKVTNRDDPKHIDMPDAIGRAVDLSEQYTVIPDIEYIRENNFQATLDIYQKKGPEARAALVYIHGGGCPEFCKSRSRPHLHSTDSCSRSPREWPLQSLA